MQIRQLAKFGLAAAILASGCDCGPGPLVPVHGKVTYQGMSLHSGLIVFTPDPERGTSGPIARADIQMDGSYTLTTGELPGAAAGWHRVTVVALEGGPSGAAGPLVVPHSLLPDKYRDPELSGLVREVKAGVDNVLDFHLE